LIFITQSILELSSTLGYGGGTIKRQNAIGLFLVLAISVFLISVTAVVQNQNMVNTDSKIVSIGKSPLIIGADSNLKTVNAASYRKYYVYRYVYKWKKLRGKWKKVRYIKRYVKYRKVDPMQKYKVTTRNCQSNDPNIKALAYQLTNPTPSNDTNDTNATLKPLTDYQKAYNIYEWTEKNVDYSWYYNSRKGAVGVLNQRTANCCDMAHMMVALARAAGLPARYRHGTCTFTNVTTGHVWADIYVDGRWIIADASNNNNDFGVIRNWNTSSWKLRGTYISLPF